jgi:hypothetical protein
MGTKTDGQGDKRGRGLIGTGTNRHETQGHGDIITLTHGHVDKPARGHMHTVTPGHLETWTWRCMETWAHDQPEKLLLFRRREAWFVGMGVCVIWLEWRGPGKSGLFVNRMV